MEKFMHGMGCKFLLLYAINTSFSDLLSVPTESLMIGFPNMSSVQRAKYMSSENRTVFALFYCRNLEEQLLQFEHCSIHDEIRELPR
jgi:hypothetical protein